MAARQEISQRARNARGLLPDKNYGRTIQMNDTAKAIKKTQIRRALQPLWSQLDKALAPLLHDGVVVAVSGGPDSRALLESLALWSGRKLGRFVIASFDHGMRKESEQESRLVCFRAKRLGFAVHQESFFSVGPLGEAELREKRYQALKKICLKHDLKTICTAHHRDDNSEAFLLSVLGSGGAFLGAGMQEQAEFQGLSIIRPFLNLSKKELLLALSMLEQCDYAVDSLDEARVGKRAIARHEIVPILRQHSPLIDKRLSHFAYKQAAQNKLIEALAEDCIDWEAEGATICAEKADVATLGAALKKVLKKLVPDKDMRQAALTLEKIIESFNNSLFSPTHADAGLDRPLKKINVNALKMKEYSLPGVVLSTIGTKIAIRRV